MESDSDSNEEISANDTFILNFDQKKVRELRRQRKAERRKRHKELKRLRKQFKMPEFQYPQKLPSSSSNFSSSLNANIPGLDIPRHSQPVTTLSNLASPFNVGRKLDFYPNNLRFRFVSELLSPQIYLIRPGIESTFMFSLNMRAMQLLSEDNASTEGYNYAVLLRLSQIIEHVSDCFYDLVPTSLDVIVNSEPVRFGDPQCQFFESPIDISELLKPVNEIKLNLRSHDQMKVVLGVVFVRMLTVEKAIHDFKLEFNTNWRSHRKEKEAHTTMFANSNGTVRLSLKCPVSQKRLEVPCVGIDCSHFQCFDLEPYVKNHHRNFQWRCPICQLRLRAVVRDKVFTKIIDKVSPTCIEVGYLQAGGNIMELTHEERKEPVNGKFEFPDLTNLKNKSQSDRFASSIIEEIFIERI